MCFMGHKDSNGCLFSDKTTVRGGPSAITYHDHKAAATGRCAAQIQVQDDPCSVPAGIK